VKILDFGLAKQAMRAAPSGETRTRQMTTAGTIVGTVAYMSPEQARGEELDHRSDQFTFGLILYELATGKRAFDRGSGAETLAAIMRDEPEPLPADIPPPLGWVVERCLAKEANRRYESTKDLYEELRRIRDRPSSTLTSPQALVPSPRASRRIASALLAVALGAAGLVAGAFWQRGRTPDARVWTGTQLGGPRTAISPRMSPDGQLLAFIALVDGVTQVAVMKPGSNSWTELTHGTGDGVVQNVCWSHDGSKLYFDRLWGQPAGVYTIPPLGGDPVLLLDKAAQPAALPDGSLLVLRVTGSMDQAFRFWPDTGKLQPLPAFLHLEDVSAPIAVFPGGHRVAFFGWAAQGSGGEPRALHLLDLSTGNLTTLDAGADIDDRGLLSLPLAVAPDGKSIFTLAKKADTYALIGIASDGGTPRRRELLSLRPNELPWYLEAARGDSLYLDAVGRPYSILRFGLDGTAVERFGAPVLEDQLVLPLGDGRVVVATINGRSQVLIGRPDGQLRPLLQTDEESSGPLAPAGNDAVVLMVGPPGKRRIGLAALANGRLLREVQAPPGEPSGIAVSPDRSTFYFAAQGAIYAVTGEGRARSIGAGDTIALDPSGRYLYAKQFGGNPIRLVRIDTVSGSVEDVRVPNTVRLTTVSLSPTAVDARQRILLDTSSPDAWFYRPAMIDARAGVLTSVPLPVSGDCLAPGWTPDGRVVCAGVDLLGTLWRYSSR
jgi:hypothetical protein